MKVANLGRMQQPQQPVYTNILGSAHRQFVSFKTYEFELLEVVIHNHSVSSNLLLRVQYWFSSSLFNFDFPQVCTQLQDVLEASARYRSCVRPCILHRYLFCIRGCIMHRYCPTLSKALVAFANISGEQEYMNWCLRLFFALLVAFDIYCSHLIFLSFRIWSLAFENL